MESRAVANMASDDDMDELVAATDEQEVGGHHFGEESGAEQNSMDLRKYDIPSSPELTCVGCSTTSKAQCRIEAIKKDGSKQRRTAWGKTTSRKVKCRRSGKKLRVIRKTGEWCRHCYNIWRLRDKKSYNNKMELFKADLLDKKKPLRKKMDNNICEYIHLKAGGKARIHHLKGKVYARKHRSITTKYPREVFYVLKKYKVKFGGPEED